MARLVHDLGKYLCRTARNLPEAEAEAEAPLDGALLALLVADLYGPAGGPRPASRLHAVAPELEPLLGEEGRGVLKQVAAELGQIDALEPRVRAGEGAAVREARRLALGIDAALRGLARGRSGA